MPVIELTDADKARLAACGCSKCASTVTCPVCAVTPRFWNVTLAGITDGTCGDCETWNREYLLEFNAGLSTVACVWTQTVAIGCDVIEAKFTLFGIGVSSLASFRLSTSLGVVADWYLAYGVHGVAVSCLGPVPLFTGAPPATVCILPYTITLEAA
jgi:hypothetical protein